ncbi:MAG: hypothetical protein Q7R81_04910 [Candidatus Peregrinibacteria bacterium]|nr:hypothetical protein [Candidatus Peregrinibacteria bacterium]
MKYLENLSKEAVAQLMVAMVAVVIAVPLTTQALFRGQDQDGFSVESQPDMRERANADREERLQIRLRYHKALEIYRDLLKVGEKDLIKPDVNDPDTVDFYLDTPGYDEELVDHEAARRKPTTLQIEQVSKDDRLLLRRYERARQCPESLKNYIDGFYELCLSLVGKQAKLQPRVGLLNDLARAKRALNVLPNTWETRMQMLREARDPSTRSADIPPTRLSAPAAPTGE